MKFMFNDLGKDWIFEGDTLEDAIEQHLKQSGYTKESYIQAINDMQKHFPVYERIYNYDVIEESCYKEIL